MVYRIIIILFSIIIIVPIKCKAQDPVSAIKKETIRKLILEQEKMNLSENSKKNKTMEMSVKASKRNTYNYSKFYKQVKEGFEALNMVRAIVRNYSVVKDIQKDIKETANLYIKNGVAISIRSERDIDKLLSPIEQKYFNEKSQEYYRNALANLDRLIMLITDNKFKMQEQDRLDLLYETSGKVKENHIQLVRLIYYYRNIITLRNQQKKAIELDKQLWTIEY